MVGNTRTGKGRDPRVNSYKNNLVKPVEPIRIFECHRNMNLRKILTHGNERKQENRI